MNYCTKEDIEGRFSRNAGIYIGDQTPLGIAPTTDENWFSFVKVNDYGGKRNLESIFEIYLPNEDKQQKAKNLFHTFCDKYQIPWGEMEEGETVPRKERDSPTWRRCWIGKI